MDTKAGEQKLDLRIISPTKQLRKTVWTLFNKLVNSATKLLVNQLKIIATYG